MGASSRVLSWASSGVEAAGSPAVDEEAAEDSSEASHDEEVPQLPEPSAEESDTLETHDDRQPSEVVPLVEVSTLASAVEQVSSVLPHQGGDEAPQLAEPSAGEPERLEMHEDGQASEVVPLVEASTLASTVEEVSSVLPDQGDDEAYKVGEVVEGKDVSGEWWPLTLTGLNDDATFTAKVHDSEGTTWDNVCASNLRRQQATTPDPTLFCEVPLEPSQLEASSLGATSTEVDGVEAEAAPAQPDAQAEVTQLAPETASASEPPLVTSVEVASLAEAAEHVAASEAGNGSSGLNDVARLETQLEDAQERLRQREKQLAVMAEQLVEREAAAQALVADQAAQQSAHSAAQLAQVRKESEQVRKEAEHGMKILRKQLRASEAARDAAQKSADDWKEEAASAERRLKEEVNDTERELKEHQDVWRRKIQDAERRADEAARHGQEETGIVMHELQEGREEILNLRQLLSAQEEELGKARTDMARFTELLRVAAETETQLRRETFELERSRTQLQEQCSDLCNQLQHAQTAYETVGQEISLMANRLHELEFGQQASSGTEDFLRQQHAAAKERCNALELRLTDATSARDFAMQQAEDMRRQLGTAKEELMRLSAEGLAKKSEDEGARAVQTGAELERLRVEHAQLSRHHEQELQRQSQLSREEVNYLKQKNDEKDKRLEQLTCERNMLRMSNASATVPEKEKPAAAAPAGRGRRADTEFLPDLEDGRRVPTAGASHACVADTDWFLRRFSRVLYMSSTVRRIFYGYLLMLHFWGWFVMHRAAILHHPHHA